MSFQTFVTQRLAAITAAINAIATNAKKIDELPIQSTLYPASKLHVSRDGNSESLEVQKIMDAVSSGFFDTILSIGEITLDGNVVTVPAGARWQIANINYGNIADISRTVPFSASGLIRKDILVADTSNDIVLIRGQESASISIRPNIPPNTVLVTEINVTETTIATPVNPVLGGPFVRKYERYFVDANAPGQNNITLWGESSHLIISDAYGAFGNLEYLFDRGSGSYIGKSYVIYNNQSVNLNIIHNPIGTDLDRKYFIFPNNQNFILKPGEQVKFIEHEDGTLRYLGIIPDNIDLTNYYNKAEVDSKLVSVYKYKGSVATFRNLPSSGQIVGDVYDVQEDGSNYAWNGTDWDRLGSTVSMATPTLQEILSPGGAVTTLPIAFQNAGTTHYSVYGPDQLHVNSQSITILYDTEQGRLRGTILRNEGLYLNIDVDRIRYSFTREGLEYRSSYNTWVRLDMSGNYTGPRVIKTIDASGDLPVINSNAPASANASGKVGEFRVTSDFLYVCVASNIWKRLPLSSW